MRNARSVSQRGHAGVHVPDEFASAKDAEIAIGVGIAAMTRVETTRRLFGEATFLLDSETPVSLGR